CGTLTRGNGVAAPVMAGDPLCRADVIETAADGQIGIRLIDGTLFNISGGTRVALSEFVWDVDGGSHQALLDVARGRFTFVAGELGKSGSLRVNTPVASIRARSHTGGVGMLTLTALAFLAMKEAQAADPNSTLLDDDSLTYKDLVHGAFELV